MLMKLTSKFWISVNPNGASNNLKTATEILRINRNRKDDKQSMTTRWNHWWNQIHKTIKKLSQDIGCPWSTVIHLKRLDIKHRQEVLIPHDLLPFASDRRVTICYSLLTRYETNSILKRIVTENNKWILYSNPHKKKQWLYPSQKPVLTPEPSLSLKKVILCVWRDISSVIHYELLKPGQSIAAEIYCALLERLKAELLWKRSVLVNKQRRILQQDNARAACSENYPGTKN